MLRSMRARRSILTAMVCAAAVATAQNVPAQNTRTDQPLPPAAHTFQPSRTPLTAPGANPDASLEIMRNASQTTTDADAKENRTTWPDRRSDPRGLRPPNRKRSGFGNSAGGFKAGRHHLLDGKAPRPRRCAADQENPG